MVNNNNEEEVLVWKSYCIQCGKQIAFKSWASWFNSSVRRRHLCNKCETSEEGEDRDG